MNKKNNKLFLKSFNENDLQNQDYIEDYLEELELLDLEDLEYVVPDKKDIKIDPDHLKKTLGLSFNTNYELVPKVLDSGETLLLPKDNVEREILDFEYYATTTVCSYVLYNKILNKYYVGQTSNIDRRIYEHITDLNRGNHENTELQNDFNSLKSKKLNTNKCFKVYTVQNTPVMRPITSEQSYLLDLSLRKVESAIIKKYREAGLDLYNITGFVGRKSKKLINDKIRETLPKEFYTIVRELKERGLISGSSLSPSSTSVPVIIDNVEYSSISLASEQLNINRRHLYHCILSKRYPTYMTKEQAEMFFY